MKRVEKPWGHEMIWAVTDRYVGKVLHIKAGDKLSLQYHREKDETVMVWAGRMRFEHFPEGQEPQIKEMGPGEAFHVTPGLRHRMIAARGHRRLRGLDHRARRRRPPRRRLRPPGHLGSVALPRPAPIGRGSLTSLRYTG